MLKQTRERKPLHCTPISFTMSSPFLLFLSFLFFSCLSFSLAQQFPKGYSIDCGATVKSEIDGREWLPDDGFIAAGTSKNLTVVGLVPTLTTVRSFPLKNNIRRKFCYVARVVRGARYLIRTTYYYGGVNGLNFPSPPVFDQIVDGTFWSIVNSTEDYQKGLSSYYEAVFEAKGNTLSVCLAPNTYTESDPFISSLEMLILGDSLYNTTKFDSRALRLVARHSFGHNESIIRYPDDQFDRCWGPYEGENVSIIGSNTTPPVSGFWNLPPSKVFERAISAAQLEALDLGWPPFSLPQSNYYIALYFADNSDLTQSSLRMLDIHINDVKYYANLTVTSEGAAVFATLWPLGGPTKITLSPAHTNASPLINAGEVFEVLNLGGKTHTRDVRALEEIKNSLQNPPVDWYGDPCMPLNYSWTGVSCSVGERIRVIALNLSNIGLSGSLSPSIANLTALTDIWLGNNSLSGVIPDLSSLKRLEILHLENNQLSGEIPPSLGDIGNLRELFLQNNNLTGQIPSKLLGRPGLEIRTSGNHLLSPPPS